MTAPCSTQHYWISQQPEFAKKSTQYLEQHHGAVCFLEALKVFADTLPYQPQFIEPNANDRFNVFSNLVLIMPPMGHAMNKNSRICVHLQHSNGVRKLPMLSRHDTVLVNIDTKLHIATGWSTRYIFYTVIILHQVDYGLQVCT